MKPFVAACALLCIGCQGPVRVDYEAATGQPAKAGRDGFGDVPLRRFALSQKGSLERELADRVARAVELANRFVDSDANRYFPQGRRFRFTADGKLFVDVEGGEGFRMRIRVGPMATVLSEMGYSAQEEVDGFSVGGLKDAHNRPIDVSIANTFFFALDGRWRTVDRIAALLLHETTHTLQVRAQGQVSYWLEYNLRAAVLFQGGEEGNELEKVAYRVETEFWRWLAERN